MVTEWLQAVQGNDFCPVSTTRKRKECAICRRKDAELQHVKALASKARADGKALLARADSDAALFSDEASFLICVQPIRQSLLLVAMSLENHEP